MKDYLHPPREINSIGKYYPELVSAFLLITDISAIVLAFLLSYLIRKLLIPYMGGVLTIDMVQPIFWLAIFLIIIPFAYRKLYPGHGRTGLTEFIEIVKVVSLSFVTIGMIVFVLGFGQKISRLVLIEFWLFSSVFVTIFRLLVQNLGSRISWWNQPIAVIGRVREVEKVIYQLNRVKRLGYKPAIALIENPDSIVKEIDGVPAFDYSIEMLPVLKRKGIKMVIITDHSQAGKKNFSLLIHNLSLTFSNLIYSLDDSPLGSVNVKPLELDGSPAFYIKHNLFNANLKFAKRIIDLFLSALLLVFSLLFFIIISLLIKISSPGPVIFIQKRMGKNGRIFNLYKFRTMYQDAEERLDELLKSDWRLQREYQKHHKLKLDPRITPIGRLLRKTSLDEFPQMWNVIKGDMSLVGPRAYLPSELDEMGWLAEVIHQVSPGLTGWWQVMGRHDVSFKDRLRLDEYYINNFSIWIDVYILIKTISVVLRGKGV